MCAIYKTFVVIALTCLNVRQCLSQFNKPWSEKDDSNKCPKLYTKNFIDYAPVGNLSAGNYTKKPELKGLRQCVMGCCPDESCNIVLIIDGTCFHVECVSNELCIPLKRTGRQKLESQVSMILVKPVQPNENWSDVLEQSNYRESHTNYGSDDDAVFSQYGPRRSELIADDEDPNFLSQFLNNLPVEDVENLRNYEKYRENTDNDMDDSSIVYGKMQCEIGLLEECPANSECVPISMKSRRGICKCVAGTEENSQGLCTPVVRPYAKGPTLQMDLLKPDIDKSTKSEQSSETKTILKLMVSILSKEVQLPDNEVTLAAYTIPDEKATMSHYNYVWTLVDQPKDGFTGNMHQNGATVTLTDLTEGHYEFKVTVNGTDAYGEGFANVTVLPPKRINKPPQVVITPQMQTVKLPNSGAVLDGSASKDDDAIISWHWELTEGPIGYQPPLEDKPTLVLNDLKQPGNYTFKLTVEDSDHVKNYTTANITVLNHIDYPPEANAGQDIIIYLPNNNLTLNGSLSTDDHEITSWEWTKAAEDENKAVDMQNTHSPYLKLSNLSEGVYTFQLKVTDSSGQFSTAEVHVFVKPPTNTPPVADAGQDIYISLPQTWVTLDGSKSHDDNRIVAFTWRCVDGPNNATLVNFNESVTNATRLTKGQYQFSLTVLDDNGNFATDTVTVTVTQNKNSPPTANGGGDQVVSLPISVLLLNGSKSHDDFRIVTWKWSRLPTGLAAGTVILHSDTTPVLMLTNIEAGRYLFELTVTDDQGESGRDTVSVQVKPDPLEMNLLELTVNTPISSFTQNQLDSLVQKMTLLLKDGVKMNVTEVRGDIDTENTQIIFYLSEKGSAMAGAEALTVAREAGAGAGRVRSVRCVSKCSGRGRCDPATRTCRCDAFWMQSLFTLVQPDAEPDCAWSVVYASVGAVACVATLCGICQLIARGVKRVITPRKPRQKPKYRLLPLADNEDRPFTNKDLSDTETDSDVLFESKSKSTSFTNKLLNGDTSHSNGWKKNGHKSSRKVKT